MTNKYRTIITTDGEVDDMNSFLRVLLYLNEFDLEGIVLTSSKYHYAGNGDDIKPFRWTGTNWVNEYIDAYGKVYNNLLVHDKGFPDPSYLKSIYHVGNIESEGEMEKVTDGSKFLEEKFLNISDDSRKLYVQTWGGTNTTARALKSIEEKYKGTENWDLIKTNIENQLIIYIILDQDVTYSDYIAKNWNIKVINDTFNFWYFAYLWKFLDKSLTKSLQADWNIKNIVNSDAEYLNNYALIGDGRYIEGEDYEEQRGIDNYLEKNPQYERYDFISEGDSPSYFYLLNNGLRNAENPEFGGWGGRFKKVNDNTYSNLALDYNPHTKRFESEYSLYRWFDDIQNDFICRIEWTKISEFKDAPHYPIVKEEKLDYLVEKDELIDLSINAIDPNGDDLIYKSWCYFEASSYFRIPELKIEEEYEGDLLYSRKSEEINIEFDLQIENHNTNDAKFVIPNNARSGDEIHIITEVSSVKEKSFKKYLRRIFTVK